MADVIDVEGHLNHLNSDVLVPRPDIAEGGDVAQEEFFSNYKWALNPFLTLEQLAMRMRSELELHSRWTRQWQLEESRTNLYVFACAINCAVEDYAFRRPWYITPLGKWFPGFSRVLSLSERLLNYPSDIAGVVRFRELWTWKKEWDEVTESICRLVAKSEDLAQEESLRIESSLRKLESMKVPKGILHQRMKLNEGFRCQDLTPQDVFTLADRYLETDPERNERYVVIGPRTAGSYLCPLLKVYLQQNGFSNVSWITLRPRFGIHEMQRFWLRKNLARETNVILIDDYSNTGNTLRMLERVTAEFGIPGGRIHILAPIHPHRLSGTIPADPAVKVVELHHEDLNLKHTLDSNQIGALLRECGIGSEGGSISVRSIPDVDAINKDFWSHCADSFQVRLKQVYEIAVTKNGGLTDSRRILGKSVGLGWMGYHAYFVASALDGFVPRLVGLRRGILFTDWVEGNPLTRANLSDHAIERMGSYIASRTKRLLLAEDPRSDYKFLGWGWLEIIAMFRRVYGALPGYLKSRALLSEIRSRIRAPRTVIDGRMRQGEWLSTERGILKTDFEQHAFGPPELDVVDPAYDIAMVSFEYSLSELEEEELLAAYCRESGDNSGIRERVLLYKLLYTSAESDRILHRILSRRETDDPIRMNQRLVRALNFRVYTMNRFWAGRAHLTDSRAATQSPPVFFMDLDGVFDSETLGFPHTTPSGIKALSLLQAHGYTIVPNTGRSHEHVRNYCHNFGFSVGIGEYGSVLIDNVHELEVPLASDETLRQLDICRQGLREMDEVFLDPGYKYAVRAYKYSTGGTKGLDTEEARGLLKELGLSNVRVITRAADTYFVGSENDKGKAIQFYREYTKNYMQVSAAAGDSEEDIPMLRGVQHAYAPQNCSPLIRELSGKIGCAIVHGSGQKGFLKIAERETGDRRGKEGPAQSSGTHRERSFGDLLINLLSIEESSRYKRILLLLDRKGLGFGYNK